MLLPDDVITGVDYDEELPSSSCAPSKTTTREAEEEGADQGCAQGTVFGRPDGGAGERHAAARATAHVVAYTLRTRSPRPWFIRSWRPRLRARARWTRRSFHGGCRRHNAVDKIARASCSSTHGADDKIFYTTGRLTSEMVIKTAVDGHPDPDSRSGFTAGRRALRARQILRNQLRARSDHQPAGEDRIVFDQNPTSEEESAKHRRKAAVHDE
jgi:FdhD protein